MVSCKDCRFWYNTKDARGQCRAHTPNQSLRQGWPTTSATEWCGEFKTRISTIRAIIVSYRIVIEGRKSPWTDTLVHEWIGNDLVLRAIKAMRPRIHQDGDKNIQVQTQYVDDTGCSLEWRIRMVEVRG